MSDLQKPNILGSMRELKTGDPFAPFEIVVSSGDRYRIENGDNLVEMKAELFYDYPGGEKFVLIQMNQIVAVERMGPAGRGHSSRRKVS